MRRWARATDSFTTGDVILFAGHHPLHVRQRERTGCRWAQVGLLVDWPDHGLCVFESTRLSPCDDVLLHRAVDGVQLAGLAERIRTFEGAVAIRRLQPALTTAEQQTLLAFVTSVHSWPFNTNRWQAARSWQRRNQTMTAGCYFCSELVATAFQRLGLLLEPPEGYLANNFIPADFGSDYAASIVDLVNHTLAVEAIMKDDDPHGGAS